MEYYTSEYKNLGDAFFEKEFNIPIYQRLYVWENMQVKTLIDDLIRAFEHDDEHEYYLGGIVVVNNGKFLDLIDGQQRFTTLKILREILGETSLKLNFKIREDVWEHFHSDEDIADSDINRMREAKRELIAGLSKLTDDDKKKFHAYLKKHVKLIVTTVSKTYDLNKLFEIINGRGEQLKQHEILKAKLLSEIKTDQYVYGKIWDICANMDDFLEINIKKSLNDSWAKHQFSESFDQLCKRIQDKKELDQIIVVNNDDKEHERPTISNILSNGKDFQINEQTNAFDSGDEDSTQYLSIISFELFLLYSLVSFDKLDYFKKMENKQIEFKDKNLIQIFEMVLLNDTDNEKTVLFTAFIQHLFINRKRFDAFIIKNHKEIDDNTNATDHKISKVSAYKSEKSSGRKIKDVSDANALGLLQSMLYHSHTRNTQEWIIPFLKNIDEHSTSNDLLLLLKDIDNYLYSQFATDTTVLEKAVIYKRGQEININVNDIIDYLSKRPEQKGHKENDYHHISHYWFYKMDWIIWYLSDQKDTSFKFTARNSIEHISPQNPKDENIDIDKVENNHSFGNLALISVAHNSGFSNNGFKTKMGYFSDKKIKNLKISLIKNHERWGEKNSKEHLEKCISLVKKYFEWETHNMTECSLHSGKSNV